MALNTACILFTLLHFLLIQNASCQQPSNSPAPIHRRPQLTPRNLRIVPNLPASDDSQPTCDFVRASWNPDPRVTEPSQSFIFVTLILPETGGWEGACDKDLEAYIRQTCSSAPGVVDVDFSPSKPSQRAGECSLLVDLTFSYYRFPRPKFGAETDCVLSALECMRPQAAQPKKCFGI